MTNIRKVFVSFLCNCCNALCLVDVCTCEMWMVHTVSVCMMEGGDEYLLMCRMRWYNAALKCASLLPMLGCNNGGGGGFFLKVKRLVRK